MGNAGRMDPEALLQDIENQCRFVLTQPVGIEARTLATLILDMIDPPKDMDIDDD